MASIARAEGPTPLGEGGGRCAANAVSLASLDDSRRCEFGAGRRRRSDQVALGQNPCRLRRQLYSITGFRLLLLLLQLLCIVRSFGGGLEG